MENTEEVNVKNEVQGMIDKTVTEKATEINKSLEETKKTIEKSLEDKTTETEGKVSAAEAKIKSLEEQTETLKKDLDEKTETIKELGKSLKDNAETKARRETYKQIICKSVSENADKIKGLSGTGQNFEVLKAADTITVTGNLLNADGSPNTSYITDFEQGITPIQQRVPFMRELARTTAINTKYAEWVEEGEGEGDAGMTKEGVLKPLTDTKWVVRSAETKKVAARSKFSMETLEDIDWAAAEIANDLSSKVLLKEDTQILKGDGTGDNYKGVLAYAQPFTVSATVNPEFYQKVSGANRLDVLRTAVAMIASDEFMPNVILLHPVDAAMMDMTKDLTDNYILPPFTTAQGVDVRNVLIKENTGIDRGTFLVADMTKANYRIRKDLRIEFGRDGDDFSKNMFTAIAEVRGVHYIKENHKKAFIKGSFASAITMINATVPTP